MKFQVGDEVRVCKAGRSTFSKINYLKCGIVTFRIDNGNYGLDNVYNLDIDTTLMGVYEDELELVQPASQTQSQPPHMANQIAASGKLALRPGFINLQYAIPQNQYTTQFMPIEQALQWTGPLDINKDKYKCECGSHSVGIDKHSDYCPLYIKS